MVDSRDKVFSPTAEGHPAPSDAMPAVDPIDLKRRRRVAARTLLFGPRETARHLVDGARVDSLPFNARRLRTRTTGSSYALAAFSLQRSCIPTPRILAPGSAQRDEHSQ